MHRQDLIAECSALITRAAVCEKALDHFHASQHMSTLLDLLVEKLLGTPPGAFGGPGAKINPERVLEQIAIAIKHRTISVNHRWKIVYYHTRLTCVPIEVNVPDKIVLHEFTEGMVNEGFSATYWNHLKANVIKLYKELES